MKLKKGANEEEVVSKKVLKLLWKIYKMQKLKRMLK